MPLAKYTTQEQIDEMRREIQREKEKFLKHSKNPGSRNWTRPKAKPKQIGKVAIKITGWMIFIAIVGLLASAIVSINIAKSRGEVPNFLGLQVFSVESGSMEPTLNTGSMIISRMPKDPQRLKVNQIVTFRTLSGLIVTHRIIEVVTTSDGGIAYRTKGDNPINSPDQELLSPDRIIGVFIAKIPFTSHQT
ncbi:MAG: signal peptidase I [Peptococcaceae bacterium]|nr:signal peptidase I [Peptococcaceae bacterium]